MLRSKDMSCILLLDHFSNVLIAISTEILLNSGELIFTIIPTPQ